MVETRSTKENVSQKQQHGHQSVNSMPTRMMCDCGGGQSCIVDRRWIGDWVHEDEVFQKAGLPIRKHCLQKFYPEQERALFRELNPSSETDQLSIVNRWNDDANAERL